VFPSDEEQTMLMALSVQNPLGRMFMRAEKQTRDDLTNDQEPTGHILKLHKTNF